MSSIKKTPRSRKSPSKGSTPARLGKLRFHLRLGEPIGEELKIIARLHLEKSLDELSGNNVSPEPVHEARTSIKKVRAVIHLASPALGSVRRNLISELLHDAAMRLAICDVNFNLALVSQDFVIGKICLTDIKCRSN